MVTRNEPSRSRGSAHRPRHSPMYEIGERMARIIWTNAELGEIVLCWPSLPAEKRSRILDLCREKQTEAECQIRKINQWLIQ